MDEQKEAKPETEGFILEAVEEHRNLALNFIEYLKSNRMSLNDNKIKYKGKRVGVLSNNKDDEWNLLIFTQYDEYLNDLVSGEPDEIQIFVKGQIGYTGCGRCITGKCACTGINF